MKSCDLVVATKVRALKNLVREKDFSATQSC